VKKTSDILVMLYTLHALTPYFRDQFERKVL